jgi:uncharacterized membrane protein YgcG
MSSKPLHDQFHQRRLQKYKARNANLKAVSDGFSDVITDPLYCGVPGNIYHTLLFSDYKSTSPILSKPNNATKVLDHPEIRSVESSSGRDFTSGESSSGSNFTSGESSSGSGDSYSSFDSGCCSDSGSSGD